MRTNDERGARELAVCFAEPGKLGVSLKLGGRQPVLSHPPRFDGSLCVQMKGQDSECQRRGSGGYLVRCCMGHVFQCYCSPMPQN